MGGRAYHPEKFSTERGNTHVATSVVLAAQAQGLAGKQVGGSAAEVKAALRKAMWNPALDLSKL